MHFNSFLELHNDQFVIHDFAMFYFCIHYLIETWFWPFSFLPMCSKSPITKTVHWIKNSKSDIPKSKLQIELAYMYLRRELADYWRQVKVFGDSIHFIH